MMKYERLTKRNEKGFATYNCSEEDRKDCELYYNCGECQKSTQVTKRLAELEDKIEYGTLIELPCKVGDTVWYIESYGFGRYRVEDMEVVGFNFSKYENSIQAVGRYEERASKIYKTREEAEKRLKEMQE